MPRKSARSVTINPGVRCLQVYPTRETTRNLSKLKTVGIRLSREQAIHLARVLLAVSQDWDEIEITGFRLKKGRDGLYPLTVTSSRK